MKKALLVSSFVVACSGSSASQVPLPGDTATSTAPAEPAVGADAPNGEPAQNGGASPEPEAPGPSPATTVVDCKAYAGAFCAKASACGHLVAKIMGAACEARIAGECEARAIANGTGRTAKALATCTSALPSLACADAFGETAPPPCTFVGTLGLGSDCAFDDQCATAACSASATKCGKCVVRTKTTRAPKAELGEACDESGKSAPDCDSHFGLWCDGVTKTCAEIPTAPLGGSCGYLGGMVVMCASGGTCAPAAAGSGTCVAEKGLGEPCASAATHAECAFGTSCISGTCAYPTAAALCQ